MAESFLLGDDEEPGLEPEEEAEGDAAARPEQERGRGRERSALLDTGMLERLPFVEEGVSEGGAEEAAAGEYDIDYAQPMAGAGQGAGVYETVSSGESYTARAFFTLLLYWVGYLPGLIANMVWLSAARREQRDYGGDVKGKGCLTLLIWVHLWIPLCLALVLTVAAYVSGRSIVDEAVKYYRAVLEYVQKTAQ
ncbi:MAG: hypothetical protein JW909_01860 [Planctomycetes bacterium]|nr:hypothetical protein [Planctomycetota bacterium]